MTGDGVTILVVCPKCFSTMHVEVTAPYKICPICGNKSTIHNNLKGEEGIGPHARIKTERADGERGRV